MKKQTPRTRERRERTRREILRVAEKILLRQGIEAVTLASVASELHLTKQALYHYFPSKEALVGHLTASLLQDEVDAIVDAVNAVGQRTNLLGVMLRAFYTHYIENLDAFRAVYCQSQIGDSSPFKLDEETLREEINPRTRHLFDVLEEKLSGTSADKQERARLRRLAFCAWLSALGLITMLGVVEKTGDPLIHADADLLDMLSEVFAMASQEAQGKA